MKQGIIKLASVTPKIKLGNIKYNTKHIIELLDSLSNKKVDVALFSRFTLSGYTLMDLFKNKSILEEIDKNIQFLCDSTKEYNLIIVLSSPILISNRIIDATLIINKGEILAIKYNTILDKFSEYDENKIFYIPDDNELFEYKNIILKKDIGFICNDIKFSISSTPLRNEYIKNLIEEAQSCNILLHNCSKEDYISNNDDEIIKFIAKVNQIGYVYAGSCVGESSTDIVYNSNKLIIEAERNAFNIYDDNEVLIAYINSRLILSKPKLNNEVVRFSIADDEGSLQAYKPRKTPFFENEYDSEKALRLQILSLAQRMEAIDCKKLVLGVSGGLDSTLALIVCVETMKFLRLPLENIIAVTMPSFGTSKTTKNNAIQLFKAFDITRYEYNITSVVTKHLNLIEHGIENTDTTFENAQARERTQILLNISNMNNAIVVGTGDLSEIALGFATFNGDHISNYSVNAGVPKTFIKEIIKTYARTQSKKIQYILLSIIDTPISPELLPVDNNGEICQKTENIIGPYELHDFFIYYFIKYNLNSDDLILLAKYAFKDIYDEEIIKKCLDIFYKRFLQNQFKRSCSPDAAKISEISLSPRSALRMPSDVNIESIHR